MRIHRAFFVLSSFVALAAALTPAPSLALTAAETSCRDAIADGLTRYVRGVAKIVVKCHDRRSTGDVELAVDCNDVDQADDAGRLARARDKFSGDVADECTGAATLLADYDECPAPAESADDGGATTGIDSFAELAACLAALADSRFGNLARDAEGNPQETLLDPLRKCQKTLGKGVTKLVRAIMGERRRCQRAADSTGDGSYDCENADLRGRIEKTRSKYTARILKVCDYAPEVLGKLEACSDDTTALAACSRSSADMHASALIRAAYDTSSTVTTTTTLSTTTTTMPSGPACGASAPACNGTCPTGTACETDGSSCTCVVQGSGPCAPAQITRMIKARYSGVPSMTTLSTGWSGKAIDVDVPDHTGDTVNVTCDANCENCEIDLNTDVDNPASLCRCTSNQAQNCSVINGADPASCGSVDPTCRCYFGAPLALSSSGTPACVVSRIRQDYEGTMNLRTGEWHDEIRLASVVHLGISQTAPCPTCEGDIKPNDGVRDGTCAGGVSSNACDENGAHATYGPTSLDCLPAAAANVSGAGLLIELNGSTGTQTLPATLPCQTPSGALCPCRVCTGNGNLGCSSDAQCAASGAGTCTDAGGAGVVLNTCDGFECNADGNCATGPVDTYCDGQVHPDGRGFLPCSSDADCTPYSAGNCTVADIRRCAPDPFISTGEPGPFETSTGALFCVAPTSNPGINLAGGLPGPGKYVLSFTPDIRCASNPNLVYEFPSGANCEAGATTTTTLLPLAPCDEAEAPLCGGLCPTGETCGDNGSGTCVCTAPPIPLCDDAVSPVCGGRCLGTSELCLDNAGTCECRIPTLPQCTDADSPLCGGLCPTGEVCQDVGGVCECGAPGAPSCGNAVAPACAGTCDVGSVCTVSGDSCLCTSLGLPTCGEATAPLCGGTCSLGSVCQAAGDACQCITIPLP
jgi:hypothetical protein